MTVTLWDHPLSPYAQKVKIALREKGVPFDTAVPGGIGVGGAAGDFLAANPRAEVPALRAARSPRAGFASSSRRPGLAPSSRRGARSFRSGFVARPGRRPGPSPAAGRAGASPRGVRASAAGSRAEGTSSADGSSSADLRTPSVPWMREG